MVEFGARLSLKDNMSATLIRNLKLQQEFSQQIANTNASVRELGRANVSPSINATDNASDVIDAVREGLDAAGGMVASPNISPVDNASEVIGQVREGLDTLSSTVASPEAELIDEASTPLERLKQRLLSAGSVKLAPKAEIDDKATAQADKIAEKIKEVGRYVASPVIKLRDLVSSEAGKISQKLREIATNYTPIVRLRDAASQGLAKIKNTLGWIGRTVAYPVLSVRDMATAGINKVRVALSTVGKLVAKPVMAVKDTATAGISKVKNALSTVGKTVSTAALAVKDKASPIVNKLATGLKTVGKTTARAALAIKDGATKVLGKVKDGLVGIGRMSVKAVVGIKDAASAGLDKIKSVLSTLAKGVTIGVGIAGAGAVKAMLEGASLEQSMGGVETLFKGDAGAVKANADAAFRTAGLSANDYMETVTGFSASLLQSLGGDTTKATSIADMAIIDMADNANKFGTSMDSIQNAYQGFAKQNYTMLDNLKLGYGGTKEEMERLLADASKISGVKYNMDSLADVYNAIHVVQDQLGVTGTTAKEASETFSGSFASMKAAAKNLLGNLAIGGDVESSMEQLLETASTFLMGNALPMLSNIFNALPNAVKVAKPKIIEAGKTLVTSLKQSIINLLPDGMGEAIFSGIDHAITAFTPVLEGLRGVFERVAPVISETFGGAFAQGGGLIDSFAGIAQSALPIVESLILGINDGFKQLSSLIDPVVSAISDMMPTIVPAIQSIIEGLSPIVGVFVDLFITAIPIVEGIIEGLSTFIQGVMPVISSVFETVGGVIKRVLSVIGEHMGFFQTIVQTVVTVVTVAWNLLAPVIEVVGNAIVAILDWLLTTFETVFTNISSVVETVWGGICGFFESAKETISNIIDTLTSVFNTLGEIIDNVFNGISSTVSSVIDSVIGWISGAIDKISGFIGKIGDAVSAVGDWIGGAVDTVGGWLGFAYGKDRVPYNNYPAVLHEGEKVLTRNQADQYDRVMSTRGVELAPEVKPLDTGNAITPQPIGNTQEITQVKQENKGANITIEKLADTVVIEKEADVDKVVQDMVTKFRKLVPNMA